MEENSEKAQCSVSPPFLFVSTVHHPSLVRERATDKLKYIVPALTPCPSPHLRHILYLLFHPAIPPLPSFLFPLF